MSSNSNDRPLDDYNAWVDFWRYEIGVNVIPADTQNKITSIPWAEWQNKPIPGEVHNEWNETGAFKGMAVILGKIWHNKEKVGLYLNGIDADNLKAIEELCTLNGRFILLNELAQRTLVEQHSDDTNRAHIYIYSHKPFTKKSSDKNNNHVSAKVDTDAIPSIEVKGLGEQGIFFCSPSIHKNGQPYQIVGTKEPAIADDFEEHIDMICRKYGLRYLDNNGNGKGQSQSHETSIEELFNPSVKVLKGERAIKIKDNGFITTTK